MLEKYNSGMGMRVKTYITTATTVCMGYGRIFSFCNGPLTVTSSKLLLIRNCCKLSFMWQGRNILQPWQTYSLHVLRTNCVFDWLVHNQQTPCRSSYTPWPRNLVSISISIVHLVQCTLKVFSRKENGINCSLQETKTGCLKKKRCKW